MLMLLESYLPAAIIVSLNAVPVGIGSFLGVERRGPLAQAEIKGGRLDAVVRSQISGGTAADVNIAVLDLQGRLLADRESLRLAGFVLFSLETSSSAQFDTAANAWIRTVDYHVVFEYVFEATDAAQSLIARIPVHADQEVLNSPMRETTVVTDEMVRWDNLAAPALAVRGPTTLRSLEALVFLPGGAPAGAVTLRRTFEGAVTPPVDHPTLAAFLAAITSPANPERNARVTLADLTSFLAQFSPIGSPQPLGDWDLNNVLDPYDSYQLAFGTPIGLPASADRLKVVYGSGTEPFDQVAVAYLRAR